MKNLFLVLIMLAGSFSFASTGLINPKNQIITFHKSITVIQKNTENAKVDVNMYPSHTCTFRMYNADGDYLGNFNVYNVPSDMECGLPAVKNTAINGWNDVH